MWLWLLLPLFLRVSASNSTFLFGAVTPSVPDEISEIEQGYRLFFELLEERYKEAGGFRLGNKKSGHLFNFKFVHRNSRNETAWHEGNVTDLIETEKVHFLGGSQPHVARTEMNQSSNAGVLNYHCCVGPNHLYQRGFNNVFGIAVPSEQYTQILLRRLQLAGLKNISFIYQTGNIFTRSTCEAGIEFFEEFKKSFRGSDNQTMIITRFSADLNETDSYLMNAAEDSKMQNIEAVIACVLPDDGLKLVKAFHDIKYSLKAFFLTFGPTDEQWFDDFKLRNRARDLISAGQWHPEVNYTDSFFRSSLAYASEFEARFSHQPIYTAAGASAVGLTLWRAMRRAFKHCDISKTGGDVNALLYDKKRISCKGVNEPTRGYDLIIQQLAATDNETFFGRVKFNEHKRNIGFDPVTTQVQDIRDENGTIVGDLKVQTIFPAGLAISDLHYPASNVYRNICGPGFYKSPDAFEPCIPCAPGTFSDMNDTDHCENCEEDMYQEEPGQSECMPCPKGTETRTRGAPSKTSCVCIRGYFNEKGEMGVRCKPCVEGASCRGKDHLPVLRKGYWADASIPADVYPCDPPESCPGRDVLCKKGRTGRLCSACEDRHFSLFDSCIECWNGAYIVLLSIGLLLGWYAVNVNISKSIPSLEMILGWAQLANIIGDIELNWTDMVNQMFAVANVLDFDVDILEPSCLSRWGFRENFITQLCLPVVMTVMGGGEYLLSTLTYLMVTKGWIKLDARRKEIVSYFIVVPENEEQLLQRWDKSIATFLSSVDVTYVTIAKYCFDVFKCNDIAGVSVLRANPEVLCHDSNHGFLIGLAVFGIVVYVIGYPLFIAWKLYDLHNRGSLANPSDFRRFGFIYRQYEPSYTFVPLFGLVRRLLFVLVLVFLNNPAFQVGAISVLINASLLIHAYTAPFVDTYLDVLFSFLLLALMFETLGGLMFYSDNLPSINRDILEWIVMISLFFLVVAFAVMFIMEMRNKYNTAVVIKMHRDYARARGYKIDGDGSEEKTTARKVSKIAKKFGIKKHPWEVSSELVKTFQPGFVYQALRTDSSHLEDWDKLTGVLKDFISDQSDCSYLSLKRSAKFWRKLVDQFPELVDFLATTDEETRQKFADVATNLYRNFYLTKKATRLPLIDVINWRDYAPMAQWLAIAPEEDRRFFLDFVSKLFRSAGQEEAAATLAVKLENSGLDPHIEQRRSVGVMGDGKREALNTLIREDSPFNHISLEKRRVEKRESSALYKVTVANHGPSSSSHKSHGSFSTGLHLDDVAEHREEEEIIDMPGSPGTNGRKRNDDTDDTHIDVEMSDRDLA